MSTPLSQLFSSQQIGFSSAADGSAAADVILRREAAGILSQRNGATAQESRIYNTFTDASNGEWGALQWSGNALILGTFKNGTGQNRQIQVLGGAGMGTIIGSVTANDTLTIGSGNATFGAAIVNIGWAAGADLRANSFSAFTLTNPTLRWPNASPDCSLYRIATAVIGVGSGGASGAAWLQNTAGRARLTANVTNITNTLANLADLTLTLIAGRKYTGFLCLILKNSTAAEGLQIDLNGGTATFTSIEFGFPGTPPGATLGVVISAAAGTALTITTATTTDLIYMIPVTIVCNAAGTIIPRFAENSAHVSGTATAVLGSYFLLEDSPN